VLEDRAQTRLPGVLRGGFLHLQCGFPAAKLKGGDVVLKPRLFVLQAPADGRLRDAGGAGEGLPVLPLPLERDQQTLAAILAFTIVYWLSEAIPIPATAILALALAVVLVK
jgi:hypothetical protein